MQTLIEHARTFPARISPRREHFERLALGQRPQALFIACSDSRVVPSQITGAQPGDIFELRTAGHIVPRHRDEAACGISATLEYAIQVLDVPDIVVFGHSHCGAVEGMLRPATTRGLPQVRRWLGQANPLPKMHPHDPAPPGAEDVRTAAQRHLVNQLGNLRTHPCVSRRLAAGDLRLHAWFYTVDTGEVLTWRHDVRAFRPL